MRNISHQAIVQEIIIMRITDSLFYLDTKSNYQDSLKKLYDANSQISSGSKIQNSYEDSSVYVDTMRLNDEISIFNQVKKSSSKAQTFANNTDSTMNELDDTLIKFKSKLIQASNAPNSTTNLGAIADDLSAMRDHLESIANTSINGQFLFSGSALDTKPISDDGLYKGNSEKLTSLVGSGVQLPYNVDGESLFLGQDSDYEKIVSTNVKMYNKTTQEDSGDKVYLKSSDTIQDLVGGDTNTNGKTVFYLSGRKPDGSTFNDKFSLDGTSKISDLLDSIGTSYGNTSTNKVVDVSLNSYGQIEVKDLQKGNSLLEMNIFGAIDRTASGAVGGADQSDIDNLASQKNVEIISFDKSSFIKENTVSKTGITENVSAPGNFQLNSLLSHENGKNVSSSNTLRGIMGADTDNISLVGTDVNGNAVNIDMSVDNTTTVEDLLDSIKGNFGVTARVEDGEIVMTDTTLPEDPNYNQSSFDLILTSQHDNGGGVYADIDGFASKDSMNYSRRGFKKDGNDISGNISQIVKSNGEYATTSTKLVDVAGVSLLDGMKFLLSGKDIDGDSFDAQIDFSNGAGGTTFSIDGGTTNYTVFDANGDVTNADDMTYQQLNDVISMITANSLPTDADSPADGIQFDEYNQALKDASSKVETTLDYRGRINIHDKTNSVSNIDFAMYDSNADTFDGSSTTSMSFMANDAVAIQEPHIDFFKEIDDMIEAVRSGNFNMDSDFSDPRNLGIQNSILKIDHISDHVTKEHTKIGSYSNALQSANERADLLSLNVQTIRSEIADVDIGVAYTEFTQISNGYQAMLSTIAKINSMSLLNYM